MNLQDLSHQLANRFLTAHRNGRGGLDGYRPPQQLDDTYAPMTYEFELRDFGDWTNPPEATDEEDYDWQVPTLETTHKVAKLVQAFSEEYPTLLITYSFGEKNWLTVMVSRR
jgi:hypothetical protein